MKRYLPLLAILALIGAFAAQVATASASPASPSSIALDSHLVEVEFEDEGEEVEEDEFELEACEGEDFGFEFDDEGEEEEFTEAEEEELEEDCEDGAKKKDDGTPFVTAPAACQISQAQSKITTLPASGQVRLTVRYRTWAPTPVTVGLKLRDHKGAVGIATMTKQLGGRGVLNITTKLDDSVMDRARNASEFDVTLRAPKTPAFCAGALEQRLRSAKHASPTARRVYSN